MSAWRSSAILPDTVDVEAAIGDLALPWIALWQGGDAAPEVI